MPRMKAGLLSLRSVFISDALSSAAARAYKQALVTLSFLSSLAPAHDPEPIRPPTWSVGNSLLSHFLPNPQGQGPFASLFRIAIKLRQRSWLPRSLATRLGRNGNGSRRRSDEELRERAIKVLDLLHHAAELGNTDALYTLAQISLVSVS